MPLVLGVHTTAPAPRVVADGTVHHWTPFILFDLAATVGTLMNNQPTDPEIISLSICLFTLLISMIHRFTLLAGFLTALIAFNQVLLSILYVQCIVTSFFRTKY